VGSTLIYTAAVFFQFVLADADKQQIRRAFGHYVSPALLAEIERKGDLTLGGEVRDLTVMFCDVRGFTPLSEVLPPRRMLAVLNTLFGAVGAEILKRYGTIDKFVGDAIMAFWNAPVDVPNHCLRACDAALAMRMRIADLNANDGFGLKAERGPTATLSAGIGISTGSALVGNMGLESRFDYSCIGD
ncbi:MAG: adenylate/guanylate cyclase domain-containing protein, partial [Alphaproteobacteria bacterium]|nr:adenylate/guanylate cyclase domain-containing protein [Alphaproteobacteria bacterium]